MAVSTAEATIVMNRTKSATPWVALGPGIDSHMKYPGWEQKAIAAPAFAWHSCMSIVVLMTVLSQVFVEIITSYLVLCSAVLS